LGDALDRQQQWEEAVAAFRKATELNADHFGSYCGLGQSLVKLGRLDEAIAAYRHPNDVQAYRNLLNIQPDNFEIYLDLGNALAKQGDWRGRSTHIKERSSLTHKRL
jgi:tetratricopeptide (TPR) repeat protein